MTIAELSRFVESKKRVLKRDAQERASFDYILADLIGRSVARVFNNSNKIPDISTIYPTLFDSEEIEQQKAEKQDELSSARFRAFAESFNKNFKEVEKE